MQGMEPYGTLGHVYFTRAYLGGSASGGIASGNPVITGDGFCQASLRRD